MAMDAKIVLRSVFCDREGLRQKEIIIPNADKITTLGRAVIVDTADDETFAYPLDIVYYASLTKPQGPKGG